MPLPLSVNRRCTADSRFPANPRGTVSTCARKQNRCDSRRYVQVCMKFSRNLRWHPQDSVMTTNVLRDDQSQVTIGNVISAALFLCLSSILSYILGLGVEYTILLAGGRCWIQLTLVGLILQDVFEAQNPWLVILMTTVLLFLGAFEVVFQRSKLTCRGLYFIVLASLVCSLIIGILGVRFAVHVGQVSWWNPAQLIPILGMLIGNAVSGISVGIGYVLDRIVDNQDQIEMDFAFGASRFEAMQPILIEAVRLAVLPSINAMSVVGLISIPGSVIHHECARQNLIFVA